MVKHASGALLHGYRIDRALGVPIYRQLETELRKSILNGALVPAQKLPSTRALSKDLGVSRITIKTVYEQLIAEGYAEARTGAGTFVAKGLAAEGLPLAGLRQKSPPPSKTPLTERAKTIIASYASIRHGEIGAFRPGVPALDLFPIRLWEKYLSQALRDDANDALSYGHVNGSPRLRRAIARHLKDARGMQVDPDQIVITAGGQQAFVMMAFVFLGQGQVVWYEEPGHIAGRDVMKLMGADVMPVPIDDEGLDLEFAEKNFPKPTIIFTTPSHQQPLGTTMSLARRLALLNYAKANDAWIIEDDYDSEFRYRGRPLPALSALDAARRVVYVGTFSKSMFASARLGYIVVPPEFAETFARTRNLLGQSSSTVVENAMARFIEDGRFVEHIRKMRRVYRERRDILSDCLQRTCSDFLDVQPTDAGMHMLTWLKHGVPDKRAHAVLLEAGIDSLPLSVYASEPLKRSALVLGFTGVKEECIPGIVDRMAESLASC